MTKIHSTYAVFYSYLAMETDHVNHIHNVQGIPQTD